MLFAVFFRLSTWELWLIIGGIVMGFVAVGYLAGRYLRLKAETLREPVGIVQGAFFALVGLILAFGLTLAIGRYDTRRAAVVDDANTIGTTYLRAQTLAEPVRTRSLQLLRQYTDASLALSHAVPTTGRFGRVVAQQDVLQRRLWGLAGDALRASPRDSAPRLYVETLNEMIDQQTVRVAALNNRIPNAVLALEVFGAAFAFGLLALFTAMHGRGAPTVVLAGALVSILLLVIFDLDRPTRGLIRVPDTPLVALRAQMALPPAANGP
ncbi:MAG: bestrophin-like domain [Gaiellaceae bacterium]